MPNRKLRKIQAKLKARQEAYVPVHPVNGMACHEPGSQNRKK